MRKPLAILFLFLFTCGEVRAKSSFFVRNHLSLMTISDIPQPVSFENQAAAPPGANEGYVGAPETPGAGSNPDADAGGQDRAVPEETKNAGEEATEREHRESDRESRETEGKEGVKDQENRERERESREREGNEADAKERDAKEGNKDQENRERERESREREQREQEKKSKGDNNKGKKKDKESDAKEDAPKDERGKGGGWRERGAKNSYGFREVVRLAEGPTTAGSDMPTKYLSDTRRQSYDRPLPYWPIPATTIGTPSAHGADWTDVFAGLGVQNRARFGNLPNSTAIVGFGVGSSTENVGLEIGISSFGLIRHGPPFTTGGVSLKLHHYFRDWKLGIATGYENAIYWGSPDSGQSLYLVFSKYFLIGKGAKHEPFRTLFIHAGLGDGRFRPEGDVRVASNSINPFLAVAMRAADPVNLIVNWTGSDLAAGVSVTPFRTTPISIGLSALDLLRQAGDGVRFSMVFSYGDSVLNPNFPVSWFR